MEMRVEELAARASVSVDTVRFYQSKALLDPPRREGRIAWYGPAHLTRLERIRTLQQRGFTLATIGRLVSGELDAADEALLGQLSGEAPRAGDAAGAPGDAGEGQTDGESTYDLAGLAEATGVPEALLAALEDDGLLVPRRIGGVPRYTDEDVAAARAGLRLLEWGIPLADLVELARRHQEATEAVAREAVELFARHVREPLRMGARPDALRRASGDAPADEGVAVAGLLQAYAELLPAVDTLVGHHFVRTLVQAALDHVEQRGSEEERRAVRAQLARGGHGLDPVEREAGLDPVERDGRLDRPSAPKSGHRVLETTEEHR